MEYASAKYELFKMLKNDIKYEGLPIIYVISKMPYRRAAPIKIGLTYDFKQRMSSYRTTFRSFYVHMIIVTDAHNYILERLEKELHSYFEKHRLKHTVPLQTPRKRRNYSEWFDMQPDKVIDLVKKKKLITPFHIAYEFSQISGIHPMMSYNPMPLKFTRNCRLSLERQTTVFRKGKHFILKDNSKDQLIGQLVQTDTEGGQFGKITKKVNANNYEVKWRDYSRKYSRDELLNHLCAMQKQ